MRTGRGGLTKRLILPNGGTVFEDASLREGLKGKIRLPTQQITVSCWCQFIHTSTLTTEQSTAII